MMLNITRQLHQMKKHLVPTIPEEESTPLVRALVAMIEILIEENGQLREKIQQLRDEIAVLKGEKAKPKFKPSKMEQEAGKPEIKDDHKNDDDKKRAGSEKISKTAELVIHEECIITPQTPIPPGSRFKGYRDFVVQGLVIKGHNTRYRLETWQTDEGVLLTGSLPEALQGRHFDATLCSYILYQHHHCHVTQPLLREQLTEWGIDISVGQINAILSTKSDHFHQEKNELLTVGLEISRSVTVDDSGARHQGKNGYVTQIGNELFAWFGSAGSKSRINFLECLHAGEKIYQVNEAALSYMSEQGLSESVRQQLSNDLLTDEHWRKHLASINLTNDRHIRIATEGALLGGLLEKGLNPELAIISDGAGQFAILLHGLCWIHAERLVHKLIPANDQQRDAVALVRDQIWKLYVDLKSYKTHPDPMLIEELASRFTTIFTQQTVYATLNKTLKRLHRHKDELLLVLHRPDVPLHTNGSETDIRDFVKKRKVSGGTRSDVGRQCRDTFVSLKKTCRKLGISFWQYLIDRVSLINTIPPLPTIMRERSINMAMP